MSAIELIISAVVISAVSYACYRSGEENGKATGERIGRDKQRADDIIELWAKMPDRDSRGRYKRKSARRWAA
jgi:hypothetical protein